MKTARLPELMADLYRIVEELEAMFPGRRFTPDGHLVGSLGEGLAAYHYGLELLPASSRGADAVKGDLMVEIKVTFGSRVAFRPHQPDHLLVLKLDRQGRFEEVFNGPAVVAWRSFEGKPWPSNGQHQLSLTRLASLMETVPAGSRLPMVVPR